MDFHGVARDVALGIVLSPCTTFKSTYPLSVQADTISSVLFKCHSVGRLPRTYADLTREIMQTRTYDKNRIAELVSIVEASAKKSLAMSRLRQLWQGVLSYKRMRSAFLAWLERAQIRLDAYGPEGPARLRDKEAFEREFS